MNPVIFFVLWSLLEFLAFAALFAAVWSNICAFRTHEARLKIVYDAAHTTESLPLFQAKIAVLDKVTFYQHMTALLLFRDPAKLYPKVAMHIVTPDPRFNVPGMPETMQ